MGVRIRLARFGRRKEPFYRLVAADRRCPRDGRHLDILGEYNPVPKPDGNKHLGLHPDKVKYWLSVGAQPSETAARLLGAAGLMPIPQRRHRAQSSNRSSARSAEEDLNA